MTLLEAIVAFVILALVGIACLDLSRGAAQLEQSSVEWSRAVSRGEAALAIAATDARTDIDTGVTVRRTPWRDGVDRLDVIVPVSVGRVFRLSRLVSSTETRVTSRTRGVPFGARQ